jgi:hypothetical protein
MNKITLKVPKEIKRSSIERLFLEKQVKYYNNKKFIDKSAAFLQLIYIRQIKNTEGSYVHLMAKITSDYLGKNPKRDSPLYYKYIIDTLKILGLLKVNEQFHIGKNGKKGLSRGYRVLLTKPLEVEDEIMSEIVLKQLKIDDEEHIEKLKQIEIDPQLFTLVANILTPPKRNKGMGIYESWFKGYQYSIIDNSQRVYSIITNLPREFRCTFKYHGEDIHEVDVHACQPFLFLQIVKEYLNNDHLVDNSITEWSEVLTDIDEYIKNMQNGTFYIDLYKAFKKKKADLDNRSELDSFKKSLLANIFFAPIKKPRGSARVFAEKYPTIYRIVNQVKETHGHKHLSYLLRQSESKLMNEVLKAIAGHSDWHIRLHDAILCKESDLDLIHDTMDAKILDMLGVNGKIKRSIWGEQLEQVMIERQLEHYSNFAIIDEYIHHKNTREKIRKSIYGSDRYATKDEKNESWYSYLGHIRYDEGAILEHEEISATFHDQTIYYPFNWGEEEIIEFKKYAYQTIQKHLYNKLNNKSWWDDKMYQAGLKYWKTRLAS